MTKKTLSTAEWGKQPDVNLSQAQARKLCREGALGKAANRIGRDWRIDEGTPKPITPYTVAWDKRKGKELEPRPTSA